VPIEITRAGFLRVLGGAAAGLLPLGDAVAQTSGDQAMHTRPIPSTGEALPVVGCGTWQTFDVGPSAAERAPLVEVVRTLIAAGGSVIDSSPMYGAAEEVVGDVLKQIEGADRVFVATKVWTQGRDAGLAQMERSMALLGRSRIDLMQIHNLVDWRTHLATLRQWKEAGRIRYLGVTHYTPSAYDAVEAVMRSEQLDFVQLDYAADDRTAEETLLPLAAERGIAILVNRPFGGGGLLRRLAGHPLPDWAGELKCASWAQLLLKFVLGHPAVTCVIPGTGKPQHMRENAAAGIGPFPDKAMRARIAAAV
jgi:diketogulonate reductase-like aldo/keto reductase